MLDYTIELISLAASNSLAVFCFCNLIIAILLIGSSSNSEEIKPINNNTFSSLANDENFKKSTFSDQFEKANCNKNVVIETVEEKVSCVSIDMVDFEEEEEEEEVNDDELKKRADEFIEKINRGWRAEKMQNHYSLGQ
ncbi:hypothetical protein CASFOL_008401 [Castilleja foliolosa]|uniref:Transmembrane protein n=1 Tax=Castilleja foliolosa TaxID=1961234 RepID=A0ABD3DZ51_9LAMI